MTYVIEASIELWKIPQNNENAKLVTYDFKIFQKF